ncbi:tRNA uridine synthase, partial [Globisporangium splendens]
MAKRQKVEMAADAETLAARSSSGDVTRADNVAMTSATATASAASAPDASAPVNVAAVRDLESLTSAVAHVDAEMLLAIITELRATAGVKTVNNAIAKVMRPKKPVDPAAPPVPPPQHGKIKKKRPEKKNRGREFLMSNYVKRSVAVKFLYLGERFAGFARQEHMEDTVERYLIDALVRTKLIEDIDQSAYSRCGRTDRGVSAFGQVVGVTLRSNLPISAKLVDFASIDEVRPGSKFRIELPSGEIKTITEVDYPTHINRALPEDIRVYSVVPSPTGFSARFDCTARMYRYFFLKKDMDIAKMREAAQALVGVHDFRNFCRIDTNCHTFERSIKSFEIVACETEVATNPADQMYRFEIYGRAFLWHQVRCMVQVLFLIGSGKEEPDLIPRLLDIAKTPRKPQYDMASDAPLVLHDCYFDNVQFDYSPLALYQVHAQLLQQWEQLAIKAAVLRSNLDTIAEFPVAFDHVTRELDHFSPQLGQLLEKQGFHGSSGDVTSSEFAWKHVLPLLPLASRRKNLPLLTRDTGDSVDEKKTKLMERKRRRQEDDGEAAAAGGGGGGAEGEEQVAVLTDAATAV